MKNRNTQLRPVLILFCMGCLLLISGCSNSGSSDGDGSPNATFSVSSDIVSYRQNVFFDATASTDSDGYITAYNWQFGDGSTAIGNYVMHMYYTQGTYSAVLTVTDNDGKTDTYSMEIEVKPRYSISGTVQSAEYVVSDSDVNDTNAPYAPNDSFDTPQEISAPASISGYVNLPFGGDMGRSFFSGDTDDYYAVSLTKDMTLTLYMAADPDSSELDLSLFDAGQNLKDSTYTDANGIASLTAAESGDYFIRVQAVEFDSLATASVYVLNIGQTGIEISRHTPRLSDNFVPGEVMVRFDDDASSLSSGSAAGPQSLSSIGLQTDLNRKGRDRPWRLYKNTGRETVFKRLGVDSAISRSLAAGKITSKAASKLETLWMIRALGRTEGVRVAEPNYIRKSLLLEPNDTYYSYQWHYPLIGLPEAWEITQGSTDTIVAVIDSGILSQHPDLQGQIVDGYDFISDATRALDGDGIDDDPEDPGDGDIGGSSFHGTHTSGTIAARTNNNTGVAGVAWNARIMPLRVLGYGGEGTTNDILEAIRYAAGMETDAGVQLTEPVDIINMSLGGAGYSVIEEEVYNEVRSRGVIIIASAGNDGNSNVLYPAGYDSVISVSAVDINGERASYSNYGSTIDVAAPGGSSTDVNGDGYVDGVLSTVGDDSGGTTVQMRYAFYTGTSMAAPHVAGVTALMKALYPEMTPDNFDALLAGGYLTQSDDASLPNNDLGYGIIDAYKAVLVAQEAADTGSIPPILSVSPKSLNFGTVLTNLSVTVENGGDGTLEPVTYSSDASWLTINPTGNVDGNGLGTYSVSVSREGLDDGTYTATLTFEAGTQQIRISAVMRVGTGYGTADGGYHYIILVDPDTYVTYDDFSSAGSNGIYDFTFSGLPYNGTYYIYAGTDPDNDFSICTEGESCGAYLSLDQPAKISVRENMEGLNFTTDIQINIPDVATGQAGKETQPVQRNTAKRSLR